MKTDFEIFLHFYEGARGVDRAKGEILVKKASLAYGVPKSQLEGQTISRTSQGKPYLENVHIEFSVSHSGGIWAIAIGPDCCGLDVQYIKPCNFNKIAGRFFSEREKGYVEKEGLDGFYNIWCRKEAFGKYTGQGFFEDAPEFLSPEGQLLEQMTFEGKDLSIIDISLRQDFKCVLCTEDCHNKNIKIREDW